MKNVFFLKGWFWFVSVRSFEKYKLKGQEDQAQEKRVERKKAAVKKRAAREKLWLKLHLRMKICIFIFIFILSRIFIVGEGDAPLSTLHSRYVYQ